MSAANEVNPTSKASVVKRIVIFLMPQQRRVYFYSGEVHFTAGNVRHFDGVVEIESVFRMPAVAWKKARSDIANSLECRPNALLS